MPFHITWLSWAKWNRGAPVHATPVFDFALLNVNFRWTKKVTKHITENFPVRFSKFPATNVTGLSRYIPVMLNDFYVTLRFPLKGDLMGGKHFNRFLLRQRGKTCRQNCQNPPFLFFTVMSCWHGYWNAEDYLAATEYVRCIQQHLIIP